MELPPKIRQAIILRSQGLSWNQCADNVGVTASNLRAWRKHPDFDAFLQEAIKENLSEAHSLFADAAPQLASRLIHLGLDEKVRPYAQIQAITESFRILERGVLEKENREQLKKNLEKRWKHWKVEPILLLMFSGARTARKGYRSGTT